MAESARAAYCYDCMGLTGCGMLQESSSCAWGANTLEWRMQVGIFSAMCKWHLQLSKLLLCPQGCHSVWGCVRCTASAVQRTQQQNAGATIQHVPHNCTHGIGRGGGRPKATVLAPAAHTP